MASSLWLQVPVGLAAVALAAGLGVHVGRRLRYAGAGRPVTDSVVPQADPIWASLRAAESGDVDAYLACFAGEARQEVEAEIARQGREAYAQRLVEDTEAAKGVVLKPLAEADDAEGFRLFVRRNGHEDVFDYLVAQEGGEWKIRSKVPRGRRPRPAAELDGKGPPAQQGDSE